MGRKKNLHLTPHSIKSGYDGIGYSVLFSAFQRLDSSVFQSPLQMLCEAVAMCLGHGSNTVTDYYINPDFTLVDAVNRKVLDKIFNR